MVPRACLTRVRKTDEKWLVYPEGMIQNYWTWALLCLCSTLFLCFPFRQKGSCKHIILFHSDVKLPNSSKKSCAVVTPAVLPQAPATTNPRGFFFVLPLQLAAAVRPLMKTSPGTGHCIGHWEPRCRVIEVAQSGAWMPVCSLLLQRRVGSKRTGCGREAGISNSFWACDSESAHWAF